MSWTIITKCSMTSLCVAASVGTWRTKLGWLVTSVMSRSIVMLTYFNLHTSLHWSQLKTHALPLLPLFPQRRWRTIKNVVCAPMAASEDVKEQVGHMSRSAQALHIWTCTIVLVQAKAKAHKSTSIIHLHIAHFTYSDHTYCTHYN